jgi:hypothetical protein
VDWSEYDLSGSSAEKLAGQKPTYIGRVVEESQVSYKSMGLAALSFAAVGVAALLRQRQAGRLRFG